MLHQEAEFLTGFRSLESMVLCKILMQKVWGIVILVGRWVLGRKEALMLYGIQSAWALKHHLDDAVGCWESLESLWGVFLKKTFICILTKFK